MAEKKKQTAKKKTAVRKKSANKTLTGKTTGKKTAARKSQNQKKTGQSTFSPVYTLTIMVLLIIILFLINNIYFHDKKGPSQSRSISEKSVSVKKPGSPEKDIKRNNNEEKSGENDETAKMRKARIYFIKFNERTEKSYLTSVKRSIDSRQPVEAALKELIKGLSPHEERKGLLTAVPRELKLHNVRVKDRTAELNFNSSLQWGATGNILLNRIDQIVYTATQFENIDSVLIKINGKIRRTLGGDGLSISGPLQRRVN